MRYFVRSLKYLVLLALLYVGLVWLNHLLGAAPGVSPWLQIKAQLFSDQGRVMVGVFFVLAALYPRFGFVRRRVAGYDAERDDVRLHNAMQLFGFRHVGERDGRQIFRAEGYVKRLSLMWEDEIEVYTEGDAVVLCGLRRTVVRIAYQLEAYLKNSRCEDA